MFSIRSLFFKGNRIHTLLHCIHATFDVIRQGAAAQSKEKTSWHGRARNRAVESRTYAGSFRPAKELNEVRASPPPFWVTEPCPQWRSQTTTNTRLLSCRSLQPASRATLREWHASPCGPQYRGSRVAKQCMERIWTKQRADTKRGLYIAAFIIWGKKYFADVCGC